MVSPQPFLLQAEQHQLSQTVLIADLLQPSAYFYGPPMDLLQQVHVLLVLRPPELDAGLEISPEQSRGAESPPLTCWPWCF